MAAAARAVVREAVVREAVVRAVEREAEQGPAAATAVLAMVSMVDMLKEAVVYEVVLPTAA